MLEQRRERRTRAYLGGRIVTDPRLTAINCLVRNTSGAGARLVVASGALLPDEFDLHIPKTQAQYRVRARWRRSEELGVEVAPAPVAAAPVALELARRIKRLEAENAGLKRRLGDEH